MPDYAATAIAEQLRGLKKFQSRLCVLGKAQFRQLFRERAMQLGDKFNLRQFIDEFLAVGMIPMSLTRWEMTGYDDEIKELW